MYHRRTLAVALIALITSGFLFAQAGERRRIGEHSGSFFNLLHMQSVQNELQVTPEQAKRILEIGSELRGRPQPPGVDFRTADVDQIHAAIKERRERADANEQERLAKLSDVLDESQLKRLRGLGVQRYGAIVALHNQNIAEELMFTNDQKKLLAAQRDSYEVWLATTGMGLLKGGGFASFYTARRAFDDKAIAVLTEEQNSTLEAIKGAVFNFDPAG